MATEKETTMVLKVDLDCYRCYTKVKRTLCQFPQVQDQIYNTKQNLVMIKVVCCSPEKIRDKICYKGGKSIKGIEIVAPKKPADNKPAGAAPPLDKPAGGPPPDKKPADKPKDDKPAPEAAANDKPAKKNVTFEGAPPSKPKGDGGAPGGAPSKPKGDAPPSKGAGGGGGDGGGGGGDAAAAKPKGDQAAAMAYMMPPPVYGYGYPVNVRCLDCYEGRMCYQHGPGNGYGYGRGYGMPPPPPPPPAQGGWGYCGGGAGPNGYGQSYKPGYCVTRYGDYVSDENATGCVVM